MARKKPLSSYPQEYFAIFRTGSWSTLNIKHETQTQAEATRNELYTFRSVLYAEPGKMFSDLKRKAQNVRLFINGDTLTLEPIIPQEKEG